MLKTIGVPSGIGDVSWIYSKLKACGPLVYEVCDGWPHRTVPFLKMLPQVEDASYGKFTYTELVRFEENHGVEVTPRWDDLQGRTGLLFLEANRHLERGLPLADWMPDLPTDYHYRINVPVEDVNRAESLIRNLPKPIWGISAASYRGSEAWKTWGHAEWAEFLHRWFIKYGGSILLMGGFWDDLTFSLASEGYSEIVGKTNTAMMVHLMSVLDGYIGFSSGMGVLRTVFKKPVFMMWPDHQVELSRSWAPPEMLENRSYVATLWRDPDTVFNSAQVWHSANFE